MEQGFATCSAFSLLNSFGAVSNWETHDSDAKTKNPTQVAKERHQEAQEGRHLHEEVS